MSSLACFLARFGGQLAKSPSIIGSKLAHMAEVPVTGDIGNGALGWILQHGTPHSGQSLTLNIALGSDAKLVQESALQCTDTASGNLAQLLDGNTLTPMGPQITQRSAPSPDATGKS